MVPVDEATVVEKGALGPGQMIAVDMRRRSCSTTPRSRTSWPRAPFGEWVGKITDLWTRLTRGVTETPCSRGGAAQAAGRGGLFHRGAGTDPRADGRGREGKSLASMGDDTPAAVLSSQYRPLSHFFRQNFSQVTNPPIDSLREYRVMSLKTRFGNLKNVLDEDSSQTEILVLDSPFVANAQFDEMVEPFRRQRRRPSTARSPPGKGRRAARGAGAHPVRGRGCRALRCGPHHPDRPGAG
jgi:glutamate synthase (NADPH/NADH) large chain